MSYFDDIVTLTSNRPGMDGVSQLVMVRDCHCVQNKLLRNSGDILAKAVSNPADRSHLGSPYHAWYYIMQYVASSLFCSQTIVNPRTLS